MSAPEVLFGTIGYGDGYGDGDGSGSDYGDGDGSGSGSGYSYGYGYGSDYGYGDGYGDGDGDGSGYGSGSGDGSGYGSGSDYGSGSGDGYGEYWAATISAFANRLPAAFQTRLAELHAAGAKIAFWRSDAAGKASNGGSCAPVSPGTIHKLPGPLPTSCGRGALHATLIPPKWKGERCWLVALIGEVAGDDEKYWALEREIIGECLP